MGPIINARASRLQNKQEVELETKPLHDKKNKKELYVTSITSYGNKIAQLVSFIPHILIFLNSHF